MRNKHNYYNYYSPRSLVSMLSLLSYIATIALQTFVWCLIIIPYNGKINTMGKLILASIIFLANKPFEPKCRLRRMSMTVSAT